jgi:hypothetical protein
MGKMAKMMGGMKRKPKPRLHISARVDSYSDVTEVPYDETKYLVEDLGKCEAAIKKIESELETFIPEDVAAEVKKSLENQLAEEKDRVSELKLKIKNAKKKRSRR